MRSQRPSKYLRINYWQMRPELSACIMILGNPNEIRLQAAQNSFISIHEEAITISGGTPSRINIQGMPASLKFAGMLQAPPFPLTLLPSTLATPIPQHIFMPPFVTLLPFIAQLGVVASSLVA